MKEIVIRKVENGYYVKSYEPDNQFHGEPTSEELVAKTDKDMIDLVTEFFFGGALDIDKVPAPEQPKDTSSEDSTETMIEASDDIVPASLPITPMADLSGAVGPTDGTFAEARAGFIGSVSNGQAQE